MVAIITDTFKRIILDTIYDNIADSNNTYFVGIGRSEAWNDTDTPTVPNNSLKDIRDFRLSMQSVKTAEDVEYVIPRYNWTSGTIYSGYDDNTTGYPTNAYYVFTNENAVYMCIQQSRDANGNASASTIQPTGTLTYPFERADGYVWKYLYTISALTATKFVSANYIPAQFISSIDSASSALIIEQKSIQDGAKPGQISAIAITNGGTGYTTSPSVLITGNGTKVAIATATISNGAVVKIEMDDSSESKALGLGYDYASVTLSGGGGTGATARPILSPKGGLGADPRSDLRATALMFNTQITGAEGNEFIVSNDFRQVAIIKNPKVPGTDSDFRAQVGGALRKLRFSTVANTFSEDNTLFGSVSGAKALVDAQDSSVVLFHQTELTGFTQFLEGETITETNGVGEGILDSGGIDADTKAFSTLKVNNLSGEIIYLDNRAAVERADEQTEDIKVIIQL
jgi:hypothetical protein